MSEVAFLIFCFLAGAMIAAIALAALVAFDPLHLVKKNSQWEKTH